MKQLAEIQGNHHLCHGTEYNQRNKAHQNCGYLGAGAVKHRKGGP